MCIYLIIYEKKDNRERETLYGDVRAACEHLQENFQEVSPLFRKFTEYSKCK